MVERNMRNAGMRGLVVPPGSKCPSENILNPTNLL
jgi:hypothetical protein